MSEQDQAPQKPKKVKEKPANLVIPPKKPKLSKAERRAIQEAQRAAKAGGKPAPAPAMSAAKGGSPKPPAAKKSAGEDKQQQQHSKHPPASQASMVNRRDADDKSVSLFSHLPPYQDPSLHPEWFSGATLGRQSTDNLHPAVLELGLKYAQGTIRGGNARCRAMLQVFQQVLRDYEPPADTKDARFKLDHDVLKPSFQYWTVQCRPHSVSMGNAFTFLKSAVASLDRRMEWSDMQNVLLDSIDAYERERIQYADKAISEHIAPKIVNGDVILVYGFSEVVLDVLLEQHLHQKQFRVIVVDSRPLLEGKRMLLELRKAGIECSYILLNALSYVLEEVTKVILGAAALMSDGSVLSRVGTACVATLAAHTNKAVLVCCETYKISHRVQLESITSNELGNPQNVLEGDLQDNLRVINLYYDLTPSQFVSGIVTEMGILPPTSVAVLLREMNPQETDSTMMM